MLSCEQVGLRGGVYGIAFPRTAPALWCESAWPRGRQPIRQAAIQAQLSQPRVGFQRAPPRDVHDDINIDIIASSSNTTGWFREEIKYAISEMCFRNRVLDSFPRPLSYFKPFLF